MYGYTADEAIGKPSSLVLPPDNLDEAPYLIDRIVRGDRIKHYETVRLRKDGVRIDVSLSVSPIRNADGKILGVSVIGRDITEAKRTADELQRMHEEARDLRQAFEDRKVIERAKGIVMKHSGLDEPAAHRRLQRLASERRLKLAEVATMILVAADVIEPTPNAPTDPRPDVT